MEISANYLLDLSTIKSASINSDKDLENEIQHITEILKDTSI